MSMKKDKYQIEATVKENHCCWGSRLSPVPHLRIIEMMELQVRPAGQAGYPISLVASLDTVPVKCCVPLQWEEQQKFLGIPSHETDKKKSEVLNLYRCFTHIYIYTYIINIYYIYIILHCTILIHGYIGYSAHLDGGIGWIRGFQNWLWHVLGLHHLGWTFWEERYCCQIGCLMLKMLQG